MTKPRIKMYRTAWFNTVWWQCSGDGLTQRGETPELAYNLWVATNARIKATAKGMASFFNGLSVNVPDCELQQTATITFECPNCQTIAQIEVTK